MNSKLIKINVIWSIISQITSIACGVIIPRLIIASFGSEVNGLVSSINQFLNYVTLLEGGVSGVAVAALYKPLLENDKKQISRVVRAIQQYFLRLGLICTGFTLAIALAYPQLVATGYDNKYIFILTIILGTKLIAQYCLSITYRLLLRADQKVYYVSIVQTAITIIHVVLLFASIRFSKDILFVYLISGIAYLIQPIFYIIYVRKHYTINWKDQVDKSALQQKWSGFGQNIAYFIHSNTDIVLLTLFATLSDVSVYSVYLMVASAVNGLISTASSAVAPSIGNLLARGNKAECNFAFEKYEFAITFLVFLIYTCALQLIFPFVSIYTAGITDTEYIRPLFGNLLLLAEMIYCMRDPYVNVVFAAGHFKQTAKYAYTEAILNISISVILVQFLGLSGVAIGTLISMALRTFQQVRYLEKNILLRKMDSYFKRVFLYGILSTIIIIVSKLWIPERIESVTSWIVYAVISASMTIAIYTGINFLLYKDQLIELAKKFSHK